jgi:hypothetical protein
MLTVNNVCSLSSVHESEEYNAKCSSLFIERTKEYADQGSVADLGEWL